MYVDYDYYSKQYGGKIAEADFPAAEKQAEAYMRYLTYLNGDIFTAESDAVKDAVCAVADVYGMNTVKKQTPMAGTAKKSENNDGYSVTYVTEQTDGQTEEELLKKKAYQSAYMHLLPTGWLSRKARCGHADKCGHNPL